MPAKDVCMNSIRNKQRLIGIIATYLLNIVTKKALIVTSHDIYPEEDENGVRCKTVDLVPHNDETDYFIVHQVDSATCNGERSMKAISADTNKLLLFPYHFVKSNWSDAEVYLEDFSEGKGTVSIKKTVLAHINVVLSLPDVHALTGCDSVPRMCKIRKSKAISVAKKMQLVSVGQLSASLDEIVMEGRIFTGKLYRMTNSSSSQNR